MLTRTTTATFIITIILINLKAMGIITVLQIIDVTIPITVIVTTETMHIFLVPIIVTGGQDQSRLTTTIPILMVVTTISVGTTQVDSAM